MKLSIADVLQEAVGLISKYPAGIIVLSILLIPSFLLGQMGDAVPGPLLVLSFVFDTTVFFVVTQYYFKARQGDLSWKNAFNAVLVKLPALFAATFLFFVAGFAGILLLVLPGIVIFVRWGLYDYLILFSGSKITSSFGDSWRMTKGNFWRIALIMILIFIPQIIVELLPETDMFLPVRFAAQAFCQGWWIASLLLIYLKLNEGSVASE